MINNPKIGQMVRFIFPPNKVTQPINTIVTVIGYHEPRIYYVSLYDLNDRVRFNSLYRTYYGRNNKNLRPHDELFNTAGVASVHLLFLHELDHIEQIVLELG